MSSIIYNKWRNVKYNLQNDGERIAKGYEAKAIKLGWFVRKYYPKGWIVNIENVMACPNYTAEEYKKFEAGNFSTVKEYPDLFVPIIKEFIEKERK